jgi:ADP-dependent NAD(P)H-hydrate dehydratase / NAD(P)H-hydrate epimerase
LTSHPAATCWIFICRRAINFANYCEEIIVLKIASVERMRLIEAAADAAGLSYDQMMQNAGRATGLRAMAILAGRENARVTVLVGPGNNGGDGLVAGRIIAQESSATVRFYLLKKRDENDPNLITARDTGALIADAEDDQRYRVLQNMIASADLLIDALFGIGIRLPLTGDAAKLLQNIHRTLNELGDEVTEMPIIMPALPAPAVRHLPYILAVDCPSGLNCDTGALDKNAISADETITYIAAKPGLFKFPGASAVGKLTISTIGVPQDLPELKAETSLLVDAAAVRERLPARPPNSHKGMYGRALIVAGSGNYIGAPGMAAAAAYRAGSGLVTVAAPPNVVNILSGRLFEPTWMPLPSDGAAKLIRGELDSVSALLIGPGWGRESGTRDLLTSLLDQKPENFPPLIVDADGLNLLSEIENWWTLLPKNTVITPHPGEMSRLCKTDTATIQANRWAIAAQKTKEWGIVVLLKGAHTLIAHPDGQLAALPFKTDALAKAGTGDVLSGVIVGLLAQGLSPFDAAVVGGYLHGLAGELAAQQTSARSVVAGDVIDSLGAAFRQIETVS